MFRRPSPEDSVSAVRLNVDFERWVNIVRRTGITRMEGLAPQRILW